MADSMEVLAILDGYDPHDASHGIGEVYSPPRVVPFARQQGLTGGWSLDLTTEDHRGRT